MTTVSVLVDTARIIELFPFTFAGEPGDARAAADTIHELIAAMPLTDLPKLERTLRERSPYSSDSLSNLYKLTPAKLGLLERFGDVSASLLGLASLHPSGYVREEAIRRLSLVASDAVVPFLVLRLNDWVFNVRDAALGAIYPLLRPEHCRAFIACFGLLSRLEYAGRADHTEFLTRVNELLLSNECRSDLLESLKSENRFIKRASFKLALNLKDADLQQVAELALADGDTAIRGWGAQAIASALDGENFESSLERMKRDRFMPVRRAALRILVKLNSPHVVEELRTALLDSHASIREDARYHLKNIESIDFAGFYRQQLLGAKGSSLYPAISGLGETGSAADDRFVVPYASHQTSKIRRAALKALTALHPDAHRGLFMKALEDEVPSVSRQALKALAGKTALLSAARIWEVFGSSSHAHVKRNALSLIEKFSKWESISYLVSALCDTNQELVNSSRWRIGNWLGGFNRSFSSATPEQVTKLKDALEKCGKLLDEETRQQLYFTLRSY